MLGIKIMRCKRIWRFDISWSFPNVFEVWWGSDWKPDKWGVWKYFRYSPVLIIGKDKGWTYYPKWYKGINGNNKAKKKSWFTHSKHI